MKRNNNFFKFRRWPVSWCVHERDSYFVKGRLPDGMSKICQPKTVSTCLCPVELSTLRKRGPILYFPTLCLPNKFWKTIIVFKCPWEYQDFPRAFYNNSLCKVIWGSNRVYCGNWEIENGFNWKDLSPILNRYNIMMKCWENNPSERPSFEALRSMLHDMIRDEEQVRIKA